MSVSVYGAKTNLRTEVKDYNNALKAFEEVLEEDPEHVSAMVLKAFCLEKLGDYEGAIEHYGLGMSGE